MEMVYTYVGDIVVSVNPFKNTGCVGTNIRAKYRGGQRTHLPPHIYALVDQTYAAETPLICIGDHSENGRRLSASDDADACSPPVPLRAGTTRWPAMPTRSRSSSLASREPVRPRR